MTSGRADVARAAGGAAACTAASRRRSRVVAARRRGASGRRVAPRAASTIGRSADASSAPLLVAEHRERSAAARSRTITANGFSSRCLRSRSRPTAPRTVASHARWNPPRPLTATIAPRASAARGAGDRIVVGDRARRRACTARGCGPHAGQAFGCAWKRRSRGSSYSRWHAGHIANGAIVVAGAVVGDAVRDREARPAVRAVGERIADSGGSPDRRSRARSRRRSRGPAGSTSARGPPLGAGDDRERRSAGSPGIGSSTSADDARRAAAARVAAAATNASSAVVGAERLDRDAAPRRCGRGR